MRDFREKNNVVESTTRPRVETPIHDVWTPADRTFASSASNPGFLTCTFDSQAWQLSTTETRTFGGGDSSSPGCLSIGLVKPRVCTFFTWRHLLRSSHYKQSVTRQILAVGMEEKTHEFLLMPPPEMTLQSMFMVKPLLVLSTTMQHRCVYLLPICAIFSCWFA
jgi:hypothetical protein